MSSYQVAFKVAKSEILYTIAEELKIMYYKRPYITNGYNHSRK